MTRSRYRGVSIQKQGATDIKQSATHQITPHSPSESIKIKIAALISLSCGVIGTSQRFMNNSSYPRQVSRLFR